jgi:hypothetical protein
VGLLSFDRLQERCLAVGSAGFVRLAGATRSLGVAPPRDLRPLGEAADPVRDSPPAAEAALVRGPSSLCGWARSRGSRCFADSSGSTGTCPTPTARVRSRGSARPWRPAGRGRASSWWRLGCWRGGSAAKFSLLCQMLGYRLAVFDSFEGVEPLTEEETGKGYDFSGEYAATKALVTDNVARYGAAGSCHFIKVGSPRLWLGSP